MAPISVFYRCIFFFTTLATTPISSFSFRTPTHPQQSNFDPKISLFGDAHIVSGDGESSVKLTHPSASSSGLLLHAQPFQFLRPNVANPTSFSTEFSFSISPGNGDGIALLFVPEGFASRFGSRSYGLSRENRFLGIEFDTSMDGNVGDLDANHVGIDVGSLVSARVGNVSSLGLVLNNGEKLKSWVDYDASSKRLEIRLGKFGEIRPYSPILSYPIDLSRMWSDENVFVGLSSSNGNSLQTSSVYSWQFRLRVVPHSIHSLPVDPRHRSGKSLSTHKRTICPLTVLAGTIFATACGALLAFVVLFLWAILGNKLNVFPAELCLQQADFRYEKINVVVEKGGDGVKN